MIPKFMIGTLCITMTSTSLPVLANAATNTNYPITQSLNNQEVITDGVGETVDISLNWYKGSITTISADDNKVNYFIVENGTSYNISLDIINETVTINNNTYTLDDYISATGDQATFMENELNRSVKNNNIVEFLKGYNTIEISNISEKNTIEDLSKSFQSRAYTKYYKIGTYKKLNVK